jgi:hypothetical protein
MKDNKRTHREFIQGLKSDTEIPSSIRDFIEQCKKTGRIKELEEDLINELAGYMAYSALNVPYNKAEEIRISKVYKAIETPKKIKHPEDHQHHGSTPAEIELPGELQTPEAKEMFVEAIKAGFVEKNGQHYKWINERETGGEIKKTPTRQLVCFIMYANRHLETTKDDIKNEITKWSLFCKAFNMTGYEERFTREGYKIRKMSKPLPKWYRDIDKFFKALAELKQKTQK